MKPKVLVLTGYGINCDEETAFAFQINDAEAEIVHINDLISGQHKLSDYQVLAFPGGFSYGDDTGSGKALANKIRNNLWEDILTFIDSGKLIIGICNGFQILTNLGLLPTGGKDYGTREVALKHNETARFECRWVNLKTSSSKCVFTKGIKKLYLPIAHGEGNFYGSTETLKSLSKNDQVAVQYTLENGSLANGKFPFNPNGSLEDIAGICDPTGRVFGLMPHPERAIFAMNSPDFQSEKEKLVRDGKEIPLYYEPAMKIFKNTVNYFNSKPSYAKAAEGQERSSK